MNAFRSIPFAFVAGMVLVSLARAQDPAANPPAPPPATARAAAWREDLRFIADELPKRHANAFHTVTRDDWAGRVAAIDVAIPSLADHEVVCRLAALVAAVGDAHTSLDARARLGAYPVQLKAFADGVYVVAATEPHTDLIGARVASIDGTATPAAREAVGAMATRENDVMRTMQTTRALAVPEALHAFGVTTSPESAEFAFERDGSGFTRVLTPLERGTPVAWKLPEALTGADAPIYLRDQRSAYWWTWLDDGKIVYAAYNSCADDPQRPFRKFATEVIDAVNGKAPGHEGVVPEKLVIDVRNNGGGNSGVATPLIMTLRSHTGINRRGRLFVLIGARTQSSAMMNALQLRRATDAILVGEPTGGRPKSYGEIKEMKLPRSALSVWYSTKYWKQIEGEDPPSVMPDVHAEPSAAEFFAGRDVVMEKVRSWE
ncbi:MAG: hypothetical protein ACKVU4_08490 [Phycisphaerales bacterium]